MKKIYLVVVMLLVTISFVFSQTTVTVGGGATVTCPATPTATWTTPPSGVTFSNWSRGSGVTCGSSTTALSGSAFNTASAAASFSANKYYSFTITANATTTFTLNSFVWSTAVSTGGANFTVQYSNNGGAVTTFGTAAQTSISSNTFSGSVIVAPGTSIVIYAIPSGTGAAGTTVRLVNGSTINLTASAASLNYFWNGANPSATTASGGTGNWTTTNAWRQPTNTGSQATWSDGNIANFAGTAGTVTLPSNQAPASTVISTTDYNFTTSGASAITWSGNIGLGTSSTTFSPISTASLTASGVISGTGGLIQNGAGSSILSGTNTYTGATTINAGTLSISSIAAGGSNSSIGASTNAAANLVLGGGTLLYTGSTTSTDRNFTLTNATTSGINVSNTLTISGAAAATTGALTKTGTGTLVLSGTNAYTGGTTISAGTLSLGSATSLADGGSITLSGGTLRTGSTTGFSETMGTLALSANSTIALGTGNHSLTFSNSSAVSWTALTTLTITGWTGTAGATGTAGKIFVTAGGLSATQLGQISFTGNTGTPIILPTGELVPPAPSNTISTTAASYGPFCNATSNNISVDFTSTGTYTGNFFVQISNNVGVFPGNSTANLISLGSATSPISGTIPAAQASGTGYRVRVVNETPATQSGNDNGTNFTVTAAVTPAVSIAASPAGAICAGTNVTFTPTPTNGGTPSYRWWKNGIGTGTDLGVSATYASSTLVNGDVIACVMTSSLTCVSAATANSNNVTLTVNPIVVPSVSIAITTGSLPSCTGTSLIFTATPTNGGTPTYQWKNGSTNVGTGATFSSTTLADGDVITCVMTSTATCASPVSPTSNSITVINNTPAQPSSISGLASLSAPQTGVAYTVTNVTGVTYTWSYSGTGVTFASGQGTNSVTVDYASNATPGTLTVTPSKSSCTGTARTLFIAVVPANDLCVNAVALTANVTATNGSMVGATITAPFADKKDVWYKFTPPCSGSYTITVEGYSGDIDINLFNQSNDCPSSTTTIATANSSLTPEVMTYTSFSAGSTYFIRLLAFNGAAESSSFTIAITGNTTLPSTPGAITGNNVVCSGTSQTYSVVNDPAATSYTWTLPGTWTGTSTTNSITVVPSATSGSVSVVAVNGCGNTASSNLTVTANATPVAPVATASTGVGNGSFTANWNAVGGAAGYFVDVYTFAGANNIAGWSFPTSGATVTPDVFTTSNNSQLLTTNSGSITSSAGATTEAATSTGWNSGSGTKFWQIAINTIGYGNLTISSKQRSSNTGPRDFKIQYRVGTLGIWTDISGGAITVLNNNFTTGVVSLLPLPAVCENQSEIFLRWIMTSNIAADGGTIGGTGTSRIDDILVSGGSPNYVPNYQNLYTTATSLLVTGLNQNTTYYYVVRADNGNCVSSNSNQISVTTTACTPTTAISSFTPASGPVATVVTIKGTGFTNTPASNGVRFDEVLATTYTVIGDTMITVEVPAGINATNKIYVANASNCFAQSAGIFTLISSTGTCTMTDLIISEVIDPASGNNHYIEIFNGTADNINLNTPNNYTIQVANLPGSVTQIFDITGVIAPGTTKVYYAGSNGALTSSPAQGTSNGFNDNDEIRLLKNGSIIDRMVAPNNTGFNWRRSSAVAGPNAIYTATEWSLKEETDGNVNTDNIGLFSAVAGISFTTNPTDQGCSFSMTVVTSGTVTNYQWIFYNPSTNTWDNVTGGAFPGTVVTGASGAGAVTLTITGDIGPYLNYQFYNQANNGSSCFTASNAAQYLYPTKAYYKAVATTGDWTNPLSWQMSDDGTTNLIAACTYPTAANSNGIIIPAGSKISHALNVTLDIDGIVIEAGGELELVGNGGIRIYNGAAGADLVINGTLTDRATSGGGNGYIFEDNSGTANDASYTLGTSGTIVKTNSSSAAKYRDFYQGGIASMPTGTNGAKFIYRYNGDGAPTVAASGMIYPNLYFENTTTSAYQFIDGNSILGGGVSSTCLVQGNMFIGTTGTAGVTVFNNALNSTNPLQVNGNLEIGDGSTLTNASYNGTTTSAYGNGAGLNLKGNLTVTGSLVNNAGLAQVGSLQFSGTGTQTISGTGIMNLENVNTNNTGSGIVRVNRDFDIPGILSFGNAAAKLDMNSGNISLKSTASRTARVDVVPAVSSITYGTGKFIVERHIKAGRKWRFLSIPTNDANQTFKSAWQEGTAVAGNQTGGNPNPGYGFNIGDVVAPSAINGFDITTINGPSIKTYTPVGNTYVGIPVNTGTNTKITDLEAVRGNHLGFMSFIPGDRSVATFNQSGSTTLRSAGKLYVGYQTVSIPVAGVSENFRGVGNPYASPINMINVLNPAASPANNLSAAYYIYDPNAAQLGGFITMIWDNANTKFIVSPPGSAAFPAFSEQNNLESGAGFFVRSTDAGTATLNFSESVKTQAATTYNFTAGEPQFLYTKLSRLDANGNAKLMDGMMASFDLNNSNEANDYDILKLSNINETVSFTTNNKKFAYERRAEIVDNDTLHTHMASMLASNYKWEIITNNLDFPGRTGFLLDRYLNTSTPLNMEGSTTVNFNVANVAGSYAADRFKIVFRQDAAGPLPVTFTTVTANRNADRSVAVQWKVEQEINIVAYEVERSNNGSNFTPVHNRTATGNNSSSVTYDHIDLTPYSTDNFYRIKATSVGGQVQYSNIVKLNGRKATPLISVYPNPVVNKQLQLRFEEQEKGRYQVQLMNMKGQVLVNKTVNVLNTVQAETIELSASLAAGNYQLVVTAPNGNSTKQTVLVQ